jgi:hypothetical protein
MELGIVVHAYNLFTWETEPGGSWVAGQPELYNETLSQKLKKTMRWITMMVA